jgi:hypothetical protein
MNDDRPQYGLKKSTSTTATAGGKPPGCFQCTKQESVSWPEFQALRHHHLLRDFPTRQLLQEHLVAEGVDGDSLHSTLAWRDGIADAWGHQFIEEDGTYMPLYKAWIHGSELMRGKKRDDNGVPF